MFYFPNKPVRIYDVEKFASSLDDNWIVQQKWDGKRILPSFDGRFCLFNRHGEVTKETSKFSFIRNLFNGNFLLDGEYLRDNRIIIWDYAILNSIEEYNLPYSHRLTKLQNLFSFLDKSLLVRDCNISLIETLPASRYKTLLSNPSRFLEGLVFKNLNATNLWGVSSTKDVGSQVKFRIHG